MPILEIHNLVKTYTAPDGERTTILDIPNFTLDPGEQIALEGSSGSGKTTLLNLIAGILTPDRGQTRVAGKDIALLPESVRDRWRAEHIGYVFQTFNLLHGYSALENVELGMMFGPGVDKEFAVHLLERVGLRERMRYRPSQLSVGQQQRVALARALANHPNLVLADEPTGNLDRRHTDEAIALIRQICGENGAALLLVSHDYHVLGKFDQVRKLDEINLAAQAFAEAAAP
ncbi:MAG: ABC transporter ATP-binding protein [Candidatus Omnitrophica bacterium]|nr:ABC transporter ATP-binding protein [Candidatus Omnitrophota bacterium]